MINYAKEIQADKELARMLDDPEDFQFSCASDIAHRSGQDSTILIRVKHPQVGVIYLVPAAEDIVEVSELNVAVIDLAGALEAGTA